MDAPNISVIIPSYRSRDHILGVLDKIGSEVTQVIVVDDCCPDGTGQHVSNMVADPRVTVLFHKENLGVGAATITGFKHALASDADVIVKIDSDGQMDPRLISRFIKPILIGDCDYTKGNRFFSLEYLWQMPKLRKAGNALLSFLTKLSSGYWDIMDPTNGFIAINAKVLSLIPLDKLEKRFLFESDMLFRLNIIRAVVRDVPMEAVYGEETSNLNIAKEIPAFIAGNVKRFFKRLFYIYLLRDFNIATIHGLIGLSLILFGGVFGGVQWYTHATENVPTPTGLIFIAVLPIIIGTQLLLMAISYDIAQIPRKVLHKAL